MKCELCRYFEPFGFPEALSPYRKDIGRLNDFGECHRHPPEQRPQIDLSELRCLDDDEAECLECEEAASFPVVEYRDWCGDFQPAEPT